MLGELTGEQIEELLREDWSMTPEDFEREIFSKGFPQEG